MARPIKKLFSRGLSLAIWENEGQDGRKYYTISFEKRYRDKGSDEWKSSTSLFLDDLPRLTALLQKAYSDLAIKERTDDNQDNSSKTLDTGPDEEIRIIE